ncbi:MULTISPECIES: hypothetical protein [Bacillus]|uniref:hypothetical protein n=1 Tax=Bacillus TaxID=1386 RepID=UPI00192EAEB6
MILSCSPQAASALRPFIYALYFKQQDAGYAATQGLSMAFIILIISLCTLAYVKEMG